MSETTTTELDSLAGMAAAADQGAAAADLPAGAEAEPQEPQGPDYAREAAGAVDMFAALVVGYAPKAEAIWTEQKKGQVAAALAPVLEKYSVTMGNLPPELVLAIMAGPPLVATIKVMARQRADEAREQVDQQRTAQPAQQTQHPEEAPSTPVHSQVKLFTQ